MYTWTHTHAYTHTERGRDSDTSVLAEAATPAADTQILIYWLLSESKRYATIYIQSKGTDFQTGLKIPPSNNRPSKGRHTLHSNKYK